MTRAPASVLAAGILALFFAAESIAQSPATRPVAPTSQPMADDATTLHLKKLLNDLDRSDPSVRDDARNELMGIERADLPKLKQVIEQGRPLRPSQRVILHDAVMQSFLAGEPYEALPDHGFLGIGFDDEQFDYNFGYTGVEIRHRMPGFCAYQCLRDGDIIKGIVADPPMPIRAPVDIQQTVPRFQGGQTVVFDVLREGKRIRVAIRLDPRPVLADPNLRGQMQELLAQRQQDAQEYWEREFTPLLDSGAW